MKFVIPRELPDMNEIIKVSKSHFAAYAKLKKDATEIVRCSCLRLPEIKNKARFRITYYCKNKRKDIDNIAVAKKFIFDGLIAGKKIKNDGWNEIIGWEEEFYVDKENPRIEIEIEEVS